MPSRDRTRGPRAHEPVLRSDRMVTRATQIDTEFRRRYSRAHTELERLHVALDYLRSAEAACYRAGVTGVDHVLREATSDLLALAHTLTTNLAARGRGTPQHDHLPHESGRRRAAR
jgi:hypothetical protein